MDSFLLNDLWILGNCYFECQALVFEGGFRTTQTKKMGIQAGFESGKTTFSNACKATE